MMHDPKRLLECLRGSLEGGSRISRLSVVAGLLTVITAEVMAGTLPLVCKFFCEDERRNDSATGSNYAIDAAHGA